MRQVRPESQFPGATFSNRGEKMLNQDLLDILACPKCKGPIELTADKAGLVCEKCRLLYEIIDDIPVMLIDKAKKLDSGERQG